MNRRIIKKGLAIVIALLMSVTVIGCASSASPKSQHKASPKTEKIIFPADFVNPYFYSDTAHTPKQAAKEFKDFGTKYCTAAYTEKDGSIVAVLTEQQRTDNIKLYKHYIQRAMKDFYANSSAYHYTVNNDYTQINAWVDSNLTPLGAAPLTGTLPLNSGYIYYLTGHTGHWDITIKLYNCHDNQLKKQFTFRHYPSFNYAELGD